MREVDQKSQPIKVEIHEAIPLFTRPLPKGVAIK